MAVKGMVTIDSYTMYDNHTFNVVCTLCDGSHHMTGLMAANAFDTTSTSLDINTAIHDAAVTYITDVWGGSFNPLLDTVKIVNPANLLSL